MTALYNDSLACKGKEDGKNRRGPGKKKKKKIKMFEVETDLVGNSSSAPPRKMDIAWQGMAWQHAWMSNVHSGGVKDVKGSV